jgi:uncharacterized membrane protein YhaH (DUF805 family)
MVQPVTVFSVSGRIGRVRYIAWGFGLMLLILVIGGILSAVVSPELGAVFMGVGVVAAGLMLTIQRCHDFNMSGWLALLYFVPLANLAFWFIPGTDGPNRFGSPTPPNGNGAIAAATALPFVVVVAILASSGGALLDQNPRWKVSEAILSAAPWREALMEHQARTGKVPGSTAELFKEAAPGDSRYGKVSLGAGGVLTVTLTGDIGSLAGKTLVFQPQVADGRIVHWDCSGGTLEQRHRPGSCRRP